MFPIFRRMDMAKTFLDRIEAAISAHGMSPRAFGHEALGDPSFVTRLRKRRNSPTIKTIERVNAFIAKLERPSKKRGKTA
jgi:hypothetical protein